MFTGFSKKSILLRYFVAVYNDQQEDLSEKTLTTKQAETDYGFRYWLHVWGDDPLRAELLHIIVKYNELPSAIYDINGNKCGTVVESV